MVSDSHTVKMKPFTLIIAMTGLILGTMWADPGTDLLKKVKAQYASCGTFYTEAKSVATSYLLGPTNPQLKEGKFTVRFQRPGLIRVDWIKPSPTTFLVTTNSLYTQEGKYFGRLSYATEPESFKTMDRGLRSYAAISDGATYFIPSLLLGGTSYFTSMECRRGEKTTVNGLDCVPLVFARQQTGDWTLLIEAKTLAIRRAIRVQLIDAADSRKEIEEARQILQARNLPVPQFPTEDYTIETVIDFPIVTFNEAMKPEDFVFKK